MLSSTVSAGPILDRMVRGTGPTVSRTSSLEQLPAAEVVRLIDAGEADSELAALAGSRWPEIREATTRRARLLRGAEWP